MAMDLNNKKTANKFEKKNEGGRSMRYNILLSHKIWRRVTWGNSLPDGIVSFVLLTVSFDGIVVSPQFIILLLFQSFSNLVFRILKPRILC